MKEKLSAVVVVLALVVAGSVVVAVDSSSDTGNSYVDGNPEPSVGNANSSYLETSNGNDYTALYRQTIDSVVSLRVRTVSGDNAQGSGFVYDSSGHIVTNQHVVQNAEIVEVRFSQGEWREAEVIGTDIYTDLAVVKVENVPDYVKPLPVADSSPPRGAPVAALGSPLGFEGSISHGIVSGLNRSLPTTGGFAIPDMIQTDAPVNPGNSGGPLVTLNGNVVGVNRAKTGDNIGFAVSAELVNKVVPGLIKNGEYDHPYMGIKTREVSPVVAEQNNFENTTGIMVVEVVPGGPSSGVLEPAPDYTRINGVRIPLGGDVIVAVDGIKIKSNEDLSNYLMTETKPGDLIKVTVLRDGKKETVEIELGTRPPP